jgi:hypothetical protein
MFIIQNVTYTLQGNRKARPRGNPIVPPGMAFPHMKVITMKMQKSGSLKGCGYVGIIASVLLIMSLVVAGCTQTSSDNSAQPAAAAPSVSPADNSGNSAAPAQGAATAAPVDTSQQGSGVSPSGTYSHGQGQYSGGGNFLNNATRIASAAQTLGVSASDLTTALTPAQGARFNLTTAAAQLSASSGTTITADQLRTALGMPAGGSRNGSYQRNGQNADMNGVNAPSGTPPSGQ